MHRRTERWMAFLHMPQYESRQRAVLDASRSRVTDDAMLVSTI
jgi:hypothetical protein